MFTDLPLLFHEKYYVKREFLKYIMKHRYIKVFYNFPYILYTCFSENS